MDHPCVVAGLIMRRHGLCYDWIKKIVQTLQEKAQGD